MAAFECLSSAATAPETSNTLGESNMESSARIAASRRRNAYSATAIGLHWLIALLIVAASGSAGS